MIAASRANPGFLFIYGGGGHGLVVADAAQAAGWEILGFIDDHVPEGQSVGDWKVMSLESAQKHQAGIIVAIGENVIRARIARHLEHQGQRFATIIHPSAWISPSARIEPGVYVGPHAVVNARAQIDQGAILNSAAVIEHHCRIGEFAHIAPNVTLGGNVEVGRQTLVGLGAAVRPGTRIGDNCTIGIGAAVVGDIPDGKTAVGVPAKIMAKSSASV